MTVLNLSYSYFRLLQIFYRTQNIDGQQFYKIQQNEQLPLLLRHGKQKQPRHMTLRYTQQCGGVTEVPGISI